MGSATFAIGKDKPIVRVLGTHVTLQETLRQRAMLDLGIHLKFEPRGSAAVLQKAATRPESFDIYEQWSNSINVLWHAKAIQPIDKRKITLWDEINSLTKTGKLTANAMEEDKKIAEETGMDDYITKPITRSALISRIVKHLHLT